MAQAISAVAADFLERRFHLQREHPAAALRASSPRRLKQEGRTLPHQMHYCVRNQSSNLKLHFHQPPFDFRVNGALSEGEPSGFRA